MKTLFLSLLFASAALAQLSPISVPNAARLTTITPTPGRPVLVEGGLVQGDGRGTGGWYIVTNISGTNIFVPAWIAETGGLLTGASSLAQLQDLNWYPLARRHAFMIATVTNTGAQYVNDLTLTNWYNTGSVSNMAQLRLIEPGEGGSVVVDSYYGDNASQFTMSLTNTSSGTNALGGRILALGGSKSWQLSSPEFSVLQFGAAPSFLQYYTNNGNASQIAIDSTAAFQAAIDYVSSAGGGVIHIPSGDYKTGLVRLKPRVGWKGPTPPTGFEVNLDPANGYSARVLGLAVIHGTADVANGLGQPLFLMDGPTDYTMMNKVSFVNRDGDTVTYYSGGNSFENILFMPGYKWSWNGDWPAAAIVNNQVDGLTINKCAFGATAGPGVYLLGARGAVIRDCIFRATVVSGVFVTDTSDVVIEGNTINGAISHVMIHRANTIEVKRNQLWNTREDLVRYSGAITLEDQFGQIRGFATPRTGWTSNPATDQLSVNGGIGIDTGLPFLVCGTNLPGGLSTNTVYYAKFSVSGGITNWHAATSALKSRFSTNVVDITTPGGSGWWCETLAGGVAAADAEEIYVAQNRMDQQWDQSIRMLRIIRGAVADNDIWEVAWDQSTARFNTRTRDAAARGVLLEEVSNINVSGNQILGSFLTVENQSPLIYDYTGVDIYRSGSVDVCANQLDWLTQGVRIDSQSTAINVSHSAGWMTGKTIESATPSVPDRFNGAQFAGTNWIAASIPAGFTNISGDYCIALNLYLPSAQANNTYMPLFVAGGSTNGAAPISARSIVAFGYMFGTNMQMYLRQYGATTSDWTERRATMTEWCGKFSRLTFQRTNGVCQIWADGQILSAGRFTNGTDPGESAALYTPNVLLGTFSSNLYATNLMNRFSAIIGNAYGYPDLARAAAFSQRGNQVLHWDFIGASTTVPDLSGNGVIGNVVNLNPAIPITFGTP